MDAQRFCRNAAKKIVMINFQQIESIAGQIAKLNPLEKRSLFETLLAKKTIEFTQIAEAYVEYLEKENKKKSVLVNELVLHLAHCTIENNSNAAMQARRYIYENGYYTGTDGTQYGKQLEKEFKK